MIFLPAMVDMPLLVNLAVLGGYLGCVVFIGSIFFRSSRTAEQYTTAGRTLPGWAVGLSIFGSYISSISFLANPGKSFAGNWNAFVFTMAMPVAAIIAIRWFVPFYRRSGHVSAYEHLEQRFGSWARTYAVVCFLLTQMARMATIVYLLALALAPMIHAPIWLIIAVTGALMTVYTLLGGIRGVVWTGVLQSLVLIAGPVIIITALLTRTPGGLGGIIDVAWRHDKFSLGSFGASLSQSTFWVVLFYGLVINLGNFAVDQSYVQRYISARDDREARKSLWLAAMLYVPTAAAFFLIGTGLFALYAHRPDLLAGGPDPVAAPDKVLPHFISHELVPGLSGLVIAAIFAAAMDSNLNSMATLTLCDLYRRYFRPEAGPRESIRVLYVATLGWGAAGTLTALAMIRARNVLDIWWDMAGIFSGGMLGLFLLGLMSRAGRRPALAAVCAGVGVIVWISLSSKGWWPMRSPFHPLMATVVGTAAILFVGLVFGRDAWRRRSQCTLAEVEQS